MGPPSQDSPTTKSPPPHEVATTTEEVQAKESLKDHWKCLAACTLMSMCPFQYGLDFGLIGGLQAMIGFLSVFGHPAPQLPLGWNISPERQQLISSLMTLGAFVSSGFAGPIASYLSRRQTVWVASALCCVSNVIMMVSTDINGLYVGRLLLGLANGLFMTFAQLYIQETVTARYRGLMISAFQIWTSVGSLVGTVVDNFTAKMPGRESYLIPLGLIYIIPVVMSVGLFFIPESPRWLMQHDKVAEAKKALLWLRPYGEFRVDKEIQDIKDAIDNEAEIAQHTSVRDMLTNPIDRRRTILAVLALSSQGASGAMFMIAYGTYFFEMAHIGRPFENSCILIGVGVAAIIGNTFLITKFGRRRVFLTVGLIICGLAQLFTAVAYTVSPKTIPTGQAIVGLSVLYIVAYNGMVATYAWVSGGELPSQRLRSYTFGVATATGFFLAWLSTFTAPYFINPEALDWGPKYGYIWTPSCWIAAAWVYFFLPEVKGRTLEEIDEMFEARLPARKFRKYVCIGRHMSAAAIKQDSKCSDAEVVHAEKV